MLCLSRSWTNKTFQGRDDSTKCRSLNDTYTNQRPKITRIFPRAMASTWNDFLRPGEISSVSTRREQTLSARKQKRLFFFGKYSRPGGIIPSRRVTYLWRNGIMISGNEKRERTTQDEWTSNFFLFSFFLFVQRKDSGRRLILWVETRDFLYQSLFFHPKILFTLKLVKPKHTHSTVQVPVTPVNTEIQ